jgi:hypothetical protein
MAVVAGVVFFVIRALLALIPGLSLFLVPTDKFQMECPSKLEHYQNLCQCDLSKA